MTYRGFIAGILIAGMAVSAGAVVAQGAGPRGPQMSFADLDSNGDGQVTREEMQGQAQARFAESDSNGDGKLDRDELLAASQRRSEARIDRMLGQLDKDSDGAVSFEEMPRPDGRRMARMFDMIDSDDSGAISQEEFAEIREMMQERRGKGPRGWFRRGGDSD